MDPISSSENAADLAAPPTTHSLGQENIVVFYKKKKKIEQINSGFTVIFPTEIPREKKKTWLRCQIHYFQGEKM